jgi:hypothetical protein
MEKPSELGKKSPIEKLHETINNAREYVADNFALGEPLYVCFRHVINGTEAYLSVAGTAGNISPADRKIYQERLEKLKVETDELSEKYPSRDKSPDIKTQDALFKRLNIFEEYKEGK